MGGEFIPPALAAAAASQQNLYGLFKVCAVGGLLVVVPVRKWDI